MTQDLSAHHTPVSMAARWVEQLRSAARDKNLLQSCIANFDLAVCFAERAVREASFLPDKPPKVVYHWTPSKNFQSIVDSNLCVPDQKKVFHQTDGGIYGKGIYTSPDFGYARNYAKRNGGCFICLGLPGRQYRANTSTDSCRPCKKNYETHVSPNWKEWVFFAADQLLPCFWVDQHDGQTQPAALELVEVMVASIRKDLGALNPKP